MLKRQVVVGLGFSLVSRAVWFGLDLPLAIYFHLFPRRIDPDRSCCVLLHSFDGYKRFWPAALHFTRDALPAYVPLICASEHRPWADDVESLLTGSGSFVWRLARALHRLRRFHSTVLYLQEDMWLSQSVEELDLKAWLQIMVRHRLQLLKLSAESMPPHVPSQLANQSPIDSAGRNCITWYGAHPFAMSHHVSLFDTNFLLKSLVFAWLLGARQPKEHEIYVSRVLMGLMTSQQHPRRPVRIAAWQHLPLVQVVHASDGGELTPAAATLLRAHPDVPPVDESLSGEVFPARQASVGAHHGLG